MVVLAHGCKEGVRKFVCLLQDDVNEDEEENEDYREGKLRFAGGRGEAATYDEGDQEDRHLAARLQAQSLAAQDQDLDAPVRFTSSNPPPHNAKGCATNNRHVIDNCGYSVLNPPSWGYQSY